MHIEVKSKEEQEAEAAAAAQQLASDTAGDEALAKSLAEGDDGAAENPYLYDTRGPKRVIDHANTNPKNDDLDDYDMAGDLQAAFTADGGYSVKNKGEKFMIGRAGVKKQDAQTEEEKELADALK